MAQLPGLSAEMEVVLRQGLSPKDNLQLYELQSGDAGRDVSGKNELLFAVWALQAGCRAGPVSLAVLCATYEGNPAAKPQTTFHSKQSPSPTADQEDHKA